MQAQATALCCARGVSGCDVVSPEGWTCLLPLAGLCYRSVGEATWNSPAEGVGRAWPHPAVCSCLGVLPPAEMEWRQAIAGFLWVAEPSKVHVCPVFVHQSFLVACDATSTILCLVQQRPKRRQEAFVYTTVSAGTVGGVGVLRPVQEQEHRLKSSLAKRLGPAHLISGEA